MGDKHQNKLKGLRRQEILQEELAKKDSPVRDPEVYELRQAMAEYAADARVTGGKGHDALARELRPLILGTFRKRLRFSGSYKAGEGMWFRFVPVWYTQQTLLLSGCVTVLWHGMGIADLSTLLIDGRLIPSKWGLLGGGIYLGSRQKASVFMKRGYCKGLEGVLLECEVSLGNISDKRGPGVDTQVGKKGVTPTWAGTLKADEYCVQDPKRIAIRNVHVCTNATKKFVVE